MTQRNYTYAWVVGFFFFLLIPLSFTIALPTQFQYIVAFNEDGIGISESYDETSFSPSNSSISEELSNKKARLIDIQSVELMTCALHLTYTQTNCVDNSDGTFTATYDLLISWDDTPATGDITLSHSGDGSLTTTTISAATIAGGTSTTLSGVLTVPADGDGTTTVSASFDDDTACSATFTLKTPNPCPDDVPTCTGATTTCIGGNTFEDFNCNGTEDTHEPGVIGVQVQVYDCDNTLVGTGYTDEDGDWQVCGLTDNDSYRVEFVLPESIACWATPTHVGTNNGSDVQFVTAPACANFSVSSPSDYCQENPTVYVSCFVNGESGGGGTADGFDAFVSFDYQSNGETGSSDYTGAPTHLADFDEIGATWGVAYDKFENRVFASAVLKRHAGLGPLGTGGIYVLDLDAGTPSFSNYIDVQSLGVNTGSTSRTAYDGLPITANELPADANVANWDEAAYAQAGKIGIGGIEVSMDGNYMYFINLNTKSLVTLDISSTVPTLVSEVVIPAPAGVPTNDFFPWAVQVHRGVVYVGGVNSALNTQQGSDLAAYVYRYNGTGWELVFTGSLDYGRRDNGGSAGPFNSDWEPWTDTFQNKTTQSTFWIYPQPILSDLEFTENGNLVLSLIDRNGFQAGWINYEPDFGETQTYTGISAGELLKACFDGVTYTLESGGSCGGITSAGSSNGDGPGGGEFYWSDQFDYQAFTTPASYGTHIEALFGSIERLAGLNELIATSMNPTASANSGGIVHFNNADGTRNQYGTGNSNTDFGYRVYSTPTGSIETFGKAVGLGDMTLGCNAAPLEVGNYVWCDSIANGIQDGCERGINGINVQLYDQNGLLVGVTTTSNNGQYYFNENNVDTTGVNTDGSATTGYSGMTYSMPYFIVFGNSQFSTSEFTIGGEMYGISSLVNAGSNSRIDSDVDGSSLTTGSLGSRPNGLPFIAFTTAAQGCGNHRYDMALTCTDPCALVLTYALNACTDNNDGTFTATYDLTVSWLNPPAGDITLTHGGDGNLSTTNISAATISGGSSTTLTSVLTIPADGNGTTNLSAAFDNDGTCNASFSLKAPTPCPNDVPTCSGTANCIGGNAFDDINCNGTNEAEEYGVSGVQVLVYDCDNTLVGTGYTDSDGEWQVCGLTDTETYRIEFVLPESIACWATPTHVGTDNGSDVQFVTAPACANFSLSSPAEYCTTDPFIATPCYVHGDQSGTDDVLITINNTWGKDGSGTIGNSLADWQVPSTPNHITQASQMGTTYGMAWSKTRDKLYISAYHKHLTGFGPLGPDGIYEVPMDRLTGLPVGGVPIANKFVEIEDDLGLNVGADTHGDDLLVVPVITDASLGSVGKTSLGDLEISEDETTLYTVNLNSRTVIALDINTGTIAGQYPFPFISSSSAHPLAPNCPNPSIDFRPFALGIHKGQLFVGAVSSAESTQNAADLHAYVYTLDVTTGTYNLVLSYSMLSERSDWLPWENNWADLRAAILAAPNTAPDGSGHLGSFGNQAPQPMMVDIEFYKDAIILGFRDRTSDQLGPGLPDPLDGDHLIGYNSMGDIDCAGLNASGTYSIETSTAPFTSTCGCRTVTYPQDGSSYSPAAGDNPNGEFYFGDGHGFFDDHTENAFGGLAQFGNLDLVYNGHNTPEMFRAGTANMGGIGWMSNTTGAGTQAYLAYQNNFAKASGMGDLEGLCPLAPIEVGNYVWCDSISNGIQDACERGIDGITVQLYDENGLLVGLTTTTNSGQYYFNENNVDTTGVNPDGSAITAYSGMNYSTDYFIVFGDGQFSGSAFTVGGNIYGITATVDAGSNERIDSDVDGSSLTAGSLGSRPDGLPFVAFTTDAQGCGNHQYDLGVTCSSCILSDAGLNALTCNDNGTNSDDADDYLTFTLNPTGTNIGSNYNVSVSAGSINPTNAAYGSAISFQLQNGSAGNGNVIVTITDVDDPSCSLTVNITDPGSCGAICPPIQCIPIQVSKND